MPLVPGMRRSLKTMSGAASASASGADVQAVITVDLMPISSRMSESEAATSGSSSTMRARRRPMETLPGRAALAPAFFEAGSSTTKRAPCGATSSNQIWPRWRWMIEREIDRPMPVPTPTGLVVK